MLHKNILSLPKAILSRAKEIRVLIWLYARGLLVKMGVLSFPEMSTIFHNIQYRTYITVYITITFTENRFPNETVSSLYKLINGNVQKQKY